MNEQLALIAQTKKSLETQQARRLELEKRIARLADQIEADRDRRKARGKPAN